MDVYTNRMKGEIFQMKKKIMKSSDHINGGLDVAERGADLDPADVAADFLYGFFRDENSFEALFLFGFRF